MLKKNCIRNSLLSLLFASQFYNGNAQIVYYNMDSIPLCYSVKNVMNFSTSSIYGKELEASTGEVKKGNSAEFGTSSRNNQFLIPFIINLIGDYTEYKRIIPCCSSKTNLKQFGLCDTLKISINSFNNNIEYQFDLSFNVKCSDTIHKFAEIQLSSDTVQLSLDTTCKGSNKLNDEKISSDSNCEKTTRPYTVEDCYNLKERYLISDRYYIKQKSCSFFVNPDNSDYQNIIKTEVQKLFNENRGKNKPPIARIRIDNDLVTKNDNIYRSNKDTIILDGSSSFDEETPKKYLKYVWQVKMQNDYEEVFMSEVVSKKKPSEAFIPDFYFENPKQKLVISDTGDYIFSLQVDDGVAKSAKDFVTIKIRILEKPILELLRPSIDKTCQKSIFKRNVFHNIRDTIEFRLSDVDLHSQINLKYLCSYNKTTMFFLPVDPNLQKCMFVFNKYKVHIRTDSLNVIKDIKEICSFKGAKDSSNIQLNGFHFEATHLKDVSKIIFSLTREIKPGKHLFSIFSDYQGVKSNFDTITISYKEKSIFSVYAGYQRFLIKQGKYYYNFFDMDILKIGIRAYVFQRLYIDIGLIGSVNYQNRTARRDMSAGPVALTYNLDYDIFPCKKNLYNGKNVFYLTAFISEYRLNISKDNSTRGQSQWGLGIKPRIQLFGNKPKLGIIYFELEGGYYNNFGSNPYHTMILGFNLVYGLWNY